MIPTVLCPTCAAPVKPGDRFCSSCGTALHWPAESAPQAPKPQPSPSTVTCTACGQRNTADALTCVSCGTLLQKKPSARETPSAGQPRPRQGRKSPFTFFQSWKFTALAALILIGTIVAITLTRRSNPHESGTVSPGEEGMIREIEALQKQVDASPNDPPSILRLANLLQDVRFFPRAIDMYQRYLALEPNSADARVDLGTTYFAFSFTDTTHRDELLALAKQEIRQVMKAEPKHQLAYFNFGIISLHTGDMEEAMDAFRKCIAIDSTTDAAKKAGQFLSQHPITN